MESQIDKAASVFDHISTDKTSLECKVECPCDRILRVAQCFDSLVPVMIMTTCERQPFIYGECYICSAMPLSEIIISMSPKEKVHLFP